MNDKFWARIEASLSEVRDLLGMQIEPQKDAVGKQVSPGDSKKHKKAVWRDTSSRWVDDDHDVAVRPWLLIPYVDAVDQDMLKERMKAGKRLLQSVEQRISARELSPELLHEWGLLCSCAGALEIVYHIGPNVGRLREGSNHLDDHKYWFAHYFLRIYRHGKTEEVRDEMERFINFLFGKLSDGNDKDWFGRFLSEKPSERWEGGFRLTGIFRDDLSALAMKKIVNQPAPSNIPPLNLDFPLP